jgi:2-polyprenyl-6-methoxyphenol hydroxylase-like FAD-dependent oxidoreductase
MAMDPVTAQGISDAFRDAELLADAVATGLDANGRLDAGLRRYERLRNEAAKPMYDLTLDVASLGPPRIEQRLLYEALRRDPDEARRFLQVLTGAVPAGEFFSPASLRKLIGLRGLATIAVSKLVPKRAVGPKRIRASEA